MQQAEGKRRWRLVDARNTVVRKMVDELKLKRKAASLQAAAPSGADASTYGQHKTRKLIKDRFVCCSLCCPAAAGHHKDYKAMVDAGTFPAFVEVACGDGVVKVLHSIDPRATLYVELEPEAIGCLRTQAEQDSSSCWLVPSCSWARVLVCAAVWLGCV